MNGIENKALAIMNFFFTDVQYELEKVKMLSHV